MKVSSKIMINSKSYIYGIALFCTMFLAGKYRVIGFVGFFILFIYAIIYAFKKDWSINLKSKLTFIIILNIIYLVLQLSTSLVLQNIYDMTLYSFFVQIMIYIYMLLLIGNKNKNIFNIEKISKTFSIFNFLMIIYLLYNGIRFLYQSDIYENQFGILMLPAMCFFILGTKSRIKSIFAIVLSGFIIYLTTRRGPLLAYIVFIFTYIIWGKLTKTRKRYKIYFILVITVSIIVPLIYLSLSHPNSVLGSKINLLTIKYTGSRLFSGREQIWPYVIDIISKQPLWGSGIGSNLYDFYSINLSTHNLFLFLAMQTGIIGLVLFVILLFYLWKRFYINNNNSRIYGSLLVSIIVQQIFSLGLLSGKMALALPVWSLFAFGTYNHKNCIKES